MTRQEIPAYTIESLKSSSSETKEVDLFRFEYFARDIEHLKSPHRHMFYTFILVTSGSGSHNIDFRSYRLEKGRLFLIAPGQIHAWNELRNVKGFVLLFTETFMALSKGRKLVTSWPLFKPYLPCTFELTQEQLKVWEEEFHAMESELALQDDFTRDALFYSISYLLVCASRLSEKAWAAESKPSQDNLYIFQELIESKFEKYHLPSQYASELNITANHLNALCRKKSGKSAGELIRERILLEAKRLLAHTLMSSAEIAYRLGFSDNSYFGRFFKKNTGSTPEKFREREVGKRGLGA